MKTYILFFSILTTLLLFSCRKKGCTDPNATNYNASATKDDGSCETEIANCYDTISPTNHAGTISADETWSSNEIHLLVGKVVVPSGITLTIEPGTIIKSSEGIGSLISALVIERGAQINAVGTAQSPIIFTSILDNIALGQLSGTNLNESDAGLWGGVIILGAAPISAADGDTQTQITGLPTGELFYGGTDLNDNSGIFKYVSIRHAGALIGAGNKLAGLTLAGVGSTTEIDFIEVVACQDDGIELFGGSVNVSNAVIGFSNDDALAAESNYDGNISNAFIICDNDSDKAIDLRGPDGTTNTNGTLTLANSSVVHFQGGTLISQLTKEVNGIVSNVNFGGDVQFSASYESDCLTALPDALNNLIGPNPSLSFSNCQRGAINITTASTNGSSSICPIPTSDQVAAASAFTNSSAVGADNLVFQNWTWLSLNGKL